jgi:Zn-dependent oligopeptidase
MDFQKPVPRGGLDLQELTFLVHELGHICHLLLCEAKYNAFNAYATPWDFMELPSQLVENFLLGENLGQAVLFNSG